MLYLVILVVIVVGFYLVLMCCEKKFIYFPQPYPIGDWETGKLTLDGIAYQIKDCYLNTSDGKKIHADDIIENIN